MENDKFLKLTNTVYKILEFFPESDPLKNRAKDKALSIMEHLVLINENSGWASFQKEKVKVQLSEDIDVLLGYLWIAKSQGWLNSINCLIVSSEYEKIKKSISPVMELTLKLPGLDFKARESQAPIKPSAPVLDNTGATKEEAPDLFSISERQRQILEFLQKNEKAQVMDLQTIFPDITKRTIRRDLDELLEVGKIARFGDFNEIFYQLKR
ncbi:MAG: DeoR family transcriptional regulator [Candidatus Staskawiczbacteria bacterium]|nr:DeoR family transcriptional regulator [Candidatus Staskawiczbacteria bacterium]